MIDVMEGYKVIKKDGTLEKFNIDKVIKAINKSAKRVLVDFTDEQLDKICNSVEQSVVETGKKKVPIADMHNIVESALEEITPKVAQSYRNYRNYKQDFVHMLDKVYKKSQSIMYIGDKENSNTDSALVSTKRSLIFNQLNKELYKKFFLTTEELQAIRDGYIYIHDMSARRDTMNCFARSTKFITDQGVKSFYDFNDGDTVNVLTHKGRWRRAVVHSYGHQKVNVVIFTLNDIEDTKEIIVTPNHRWILDGDAETTDLSVGDTLVSVTLGFLGGSDDTLKWTVKDIHSYSDEPIEVWCLEVDDDHSFILEGGIPTGNCCLFDVANVLKGGFEMGNVWYNEPKTLDTAFDVIGDIVLSAAAQQYGGFTIPSVELILEPYAQKSYEKYKKKYQEIGVINDDKIEELVMKDIKRDFEQGFQGWEYKFNTVSSSRGDYPFITVTAGTGTSEFAKMCTKTMLEVRMNGQGKPGFKKPVLFPKIVFLYDENLHGKGKELEDVFEVGIECSSKTMYPDWLSLTGEGYVPSMYKKYGKIVSPMGCVDGKEIITYKFHGLLYVESFEKMWERITEEIKDEGQSSEDDENRMINLTNSNVVIWDTKLHKFTKVKYLIRNMQDNWCDVHIGWKILRVTMDHPFETDNRGIVQAKDLVPKMTNGIFSKNNDPSVIDYITINNYQYSENDVDVPKEFAYSSGLQNGTSSIPNLVFCFKKKLKYEFLAGLICKYGKFAYDDEDCTIIHFTNESKLFMLQLAALVQSLKIRACVNRISTHLDSENPIRCYSVSFLPDKKLARLLKSKIPGTSKLKAYNGKYEEIESAKVIGVRPLDIKQYSYDVTTESEHFEVSGVYSHNCRAFLSPWYERGGMEPADENDTPVFVGRLTYRATLNCVNV